MADVDAGRGQLLLITGLVLATGIVALVLLLNTAIYTQHMATRGLAADEGAAVDHRRAVADTVAGLLVRENRAGHETRVAIEENLTAGISQSATLLRRDAADGGAWANASDPRFSEGMLLRQRDADRALTSATGAANWTLARDVTDTRRFRMNVTGGLLSTDDLLGNAFTVSVVGDSGNTWQLKIYENATTSETVLAVKNGSETSADPICTDVTSAEPWVNLTAGTVDGEPCSAIQFGKGLDAPYDLKYLDGDNAAGVYGLAVNTTGTAAVETANFNTTDGSAPTYTPVVYGVRLTVSYDGPGLRYRTEIRVAPGETDV